jgi:anti-sigma-K factor RskA
MSNESNYNDSAREHIEELSSAYVLGALNDDEAGLREFESLVESGDPLLAASLEQMLGVSAALALAVPQIAPPPMLRVSLLDRVEQLKISQNGSASKTSYDGIRKPAPSQDALRLKKRTRYFIGTSILSGLLLCVLLALNVSKSAKLERSNDLMRSLLKQTDSLRQANEATAKNENDSLSLAPETAPKNDENLKPFFTMFGESDSRLVTLASAPLGTTREHLFFSPKQKKIALLREGLRPLEANKTYELWATVGNKAPVAIGTFKVDGNKSPSIYTFSTKLKSADSFAISIESGNGGKIRKGDVIFTGTVPKTGIN